jgi:hypothetical protein
MVYLRVFSGTRVLPPEQEPPNQTQTQIQIMPMKKNVYLFLLMLAPPFAYGQTYTDGLMMPKGDLCTGFMYVHDQWTDYWEGTLKRHNDNIGTITTQTGMWIGTYGINDRVNVLATLAYVKTHATQGTLRDMEGLQDLSLGVKYNFVKIKNDLFTFKAFGSVSYAMPVTDYTPDYLPLSIGSASKRVMWRANAYFRLEQGWFANVSGGYTWRSNVDMDRPSHWANGELVNSNEAWVPNQFDLFGALGFHKGAIQAQVQYSGLRTRHGDDIRRQAMPEVSNQMNFGKIGALAMYYVPVVKGLAVRGSIDYTVSGRNVGQSTTLLAGVLYTIHFMKSNSESDLQPE